MTMAFEIESVVCAGLATAIVVLVTVKIWRLLPAAVNCHFCCQDFRVPFDQRNSWTCPSCQQYNGFGKDGDYNRDNCYDDATSSVRFCSAPKANGPAIRDNGLCDTCNLNQDLKVYQLSQFEPRNPNKYDEELKEYAAHLERTYRICRYCEASLHQTLGQQDSWLKPKLLSWKLEKNRQSPLSTAKKQATLTNNSVTANMINLVLLAISFHCWAFTIIPMDLSFNGLMPKHLGSLADRLENIFSFLGLGRDNIRSLQACVLAVCVACHSYSSKVGKKTFWNTSNRSVLKLVALSTWISLLAVVAADRLWLIAVQDSVVFAAVTFATAATLNLAMLPNLPSEGFSKSQSAKAETAGQTRAKLGNFGEWQTNLDEADDIQSQDMVSEHTQLGSIAPEPAATTANWAFSTDLNEDDSDGECDISLLKIQKEMSRRPASPGSTFSLKKYDSFNSSGINFGNGGNVSKNHSRSGKSGLHLVKPPRFVSPRVAQSSWVAGGYWAPANTRFGATSLSGRNTNLFQSMQLQQQQQPPSRCSSQSSGFGSITSGNLNRNIFETHGGGNGGLLHPNSSSSTCHDFDRFSVVSEPPAGAAAGLGGVMSHPANSSFSLGPIKDQLSFYDVASTPSPSLTSSTTLLDSCRRRRRPSNDGSLASSCSIPPLKQSDKTLDFNPKANSSPKEGVTSKQELSQPTSSDAQSILHKKIRIDVSIYSLLMAASVAANVALILVYIWS